MEAIGPGDHAVEVLVDGLHESRSEPRVMLKVFPEPGQSRRIALGWSLPLSIALRGEAMGQMGLVQACVHDEST